MSIPHKKLAQIFQDPTTELGKMLKKVFKINELENNINDFIPKELAPFTRLGNYENGKLVLLTSSGIWATKLHFLIPDIRTKLRSQPQWAGLRNIEIKVAPHLLTEIDLKPEVKEALQPLSKTSSELLKRTADELSDTPESNALKAALLRLSNLK